MNSTYFAFILRNQSKMKYLKSIISTGVFLFIASATFAQSALGQWKDYLNYTGSIDIVHHNQKVFVANQNALFIYNTMDNSLERVNKLNGLSDVGIVNLSVDRNHGLIFIGYKDGNMDIMEAGTISNFAEIKNSSVVGDKSIRHISFSENIAYISTGVGILEFDLIKREVSDTYKVLPEGVLSINETAILGDTLFAATDQGLYKGSIVDDLTIFSNWILDLSIPGGMDQVLNCAVQDERIFINMPTAENPGVYMRKPDFSWMNVNNPNFGEPENIFSIESSPEGLVLTAGYYSELKATDGISSEVIITKYGTVSQKARALTTDESGTIWLADKDQGLVKRSANTEYEFIAPDGPASNSAYAIDFYDDQLWVATGNLDRPGNYNNNFELSGFYGLADGQWNNFTRSKYPVLLDTLFFDIPVAYIDRLDPSRIFVGSFFSGFLKVKDFELQGFYNTTNTSLGEREEYVRDDGYPYVAVSGFARDKESNLWVTNPYSASPLSVQTESGNWKSFTLGGPDGLGNNKLLTSILVDDLGQKWAVVNRGGIVVFDEGNSLADESDDKVRVMIAQVGSGGLPSNDVFCISKDLDGEIWVGTADGIAVFYAPFDALTANFSDARKILIQQDNLYQYLLQGQSVSAIAIDGANRKWVGTFGAGVFLFSEDGTEEVRRFTTENSPLLSDNINDIAINQETGEVFFATQEGIVSYVSDATLGLSANNCTTVYPNPVRENYDGPIAISGLTRDSQIRITDTRGNLVYQTISNGGKAIWDGKNSNGVRVATGVYFALSSSKDGESTCVSKILVVK